MREIIKLTGFDAVAPGQKASVKLPLDRLYYNLYIVGRFGAGAGSSTRATVEANITDIELSSGGQTIRQHTAAQLNYINRVNGPCNANGTDNAANKFGYNGALAINFANPWQASMQGEDLNALGTLGMTDLTLDVTIDGAAVSPKLEVWASFSYANRAPGRIVKMLRQSLNVAQAGQYDLTTLRTGPAYSRIHFFSPLVTGVEIQALGRRPAKYTRQNLPFITRPYDMGQEDAVFSVPFDYTQQLSDAFPTTVANGLRIGDLNIQLDVGGTAGSSAVFPFISELREALI